MAFVYDLTSDFGFKTIGDSPDAASITSSWLLMVVPYVQVLGDKSILIAAKHQYNTTPNSNIKPHDTLPPIIIDKACTQLSVSSSKGSHQGMLQASLKPDKQYLKLIHPGDWIVGWMCQSQKDIDNLIKQLDPKSPRVVGANSFHSGLKFIGKIDSVDQNMSIGHDGKKDLSYTISAHSFTEFDHQIVYFYEIGTKQGEDPWQQWMSRLKLTFDSITDNAEASPSVLYPQFIQAFFGSSSPSGYANPDPTSTLPELPLTPDQPYIVPNVIYNILNNSAIQADINGNHFYKEILNSFIGIQSYGQTNTTNVSGFMPSVKGSILPYGGVTYSTPIDLVGKVAPIPPILDYKPVWNVLGEFINPAMNEMYNTLRVGDSNGNIYPTFVARQKPFTTDELDELIIANNTGAQTNNVNFSYTKFSSLPRWLIDDKILMSYSVGSTNTLRHNLIDIIGISTANDTVYNDPTLQFTINGPKWNSVDIARNGVRVYSSKVNASISEIAQTSPKWTSLNGDILMNQELHLSGTFTMHGIQSPICIGDNLQYRDCIYHIESIEHTCQQDYYGNRNFYTTISVTNGLAEDTTYATNTDGDTDIGDMPAIDTIG